MADVPQESGRNGKPNAMLVALSKGYVVASVGARGRTLEKDGKFTGKAPAAIIDLKSAVKYLHFNDAKMAGDAHKIISNGTSAGGALSALLGATGNHSQIMPNTLKRLAQQTQTMTFLRYPLIARFLTLSMPI